jgi:cytochrome c-type biogenesis protein CcmH
LICLQAGASDLSGFHFQDPAKEADFRVLIEKMRCLVCQNESLAGSDAELAQDLRREIYDMIQAGQSREAIIQFMVARYGDFVLYEPPLKPSTYPLWFGPFILFGVAAFFLARTLLRKKKAQETDLSEQEQQRVQKLLKQSAENPETDK